jgi:hypothetical protein
MPYKIRKQKCKQSDGDSGGYVLSYTDKKGKKHRACHTSKKKARGQIAAIEAEGTKMNNEDSLLELRAFIRDVVKEELHAEGSQEDLDKDDDGDKDFADILISRMMAGGLSKKKAIKKSRKYDS